MKYHVGVPMVVQLTSAATHDHYLLKEVHLPKDVYLTMTEHTLIMHSSSDLQRKGCAYVTKMKKNLTYTELSSVTYVSPDGLVTHTDKKILFEKGEIRHRSKTCRTVE